MDEAIRTLIRRKLHDGRLPLNSLSRCWGGPADGEVCDVALSGVDEQSVPGTKIQVNNRSGDTISSET